jgi:uncharacterized protein (DUF433 family)
MKSREKDKIFDQPAYAPSEAARILGLPVATLRAWSFGQASGGGRRFQPVIRPADRAAKMLSFANLCELHVLSAIRRNHKISLPKVRASLDYVQAALSSDRPLLDRDFKTNGIDLFVRHASKLLNVSQLGQQALRGEFEMALARIERDRRGMPIRLFPFSRTSTAVIDQPRTVVIDPRLSFGRPVISKVAVPTGIIVDRFRAGDSLAEMAGDYGVTEADIEEALRFEQRLAA